jgi:hypothetical protein
MLGNKSYTQWRLSTDTRSGVLGFSHNFSVPDSKFLFGYALKDIQPKGRIMKQQIAIGLSITAALGIALLSGPAASQPKSLKSQLVGTWMLVSSENTAPDGTKSSGFGPNPLGMMIRDGNGNFILLEASSTLPKVASTNRSTETPAEAKAISQSSLAYFGTYTVNETAKTITNHYVASTFPNLMGQDGTNSIKSISADQLVTFNPKPTVGGTSLTTWKRVK